MRPPRDLLRPVADQTMTVVKDGLRSHPRIPAPPGVAKLVRFRQLSGSAVDAVVATLDHDAELRGRVSAACRESEVGRVGWLWLTRPDGWDQELTDVLGDLADTTDDGSDENAGDPVPDAGNGAGSGDHRHRGTLRRKLAGAERAAARAEEELRHSTRELDRVRQLADELRAERDSLSALVRDARANETEAAAQRARAVGERQHFERLLARRDAERVDLQRANDDLTERLTTAQTRESKAVADHAAAVLAGETPASTVDVVEVIAMIDRLEPALADAVTVLTALRELAGLPPSALFPAAAGPVPQRPSAAKPKRQALGMPRGLLDDSIDAAAWLLTMNPVMLVDGYNVSMTAWPDADIAEQRRRLQQFLADLAARHRGLNVEVVFDGVSADGTPAGLGARAGLNVRFTDAATEADDAILDMIARYPHDRAVVVVSADKRVRDGARRRGANVVSSHQLLGVTRG